jgi:hypothetical protein
MSNQADGSTPSGGRSQGVSTAARNRGTASPWNLRSYYQRTDHNYKRNPNSTPISNTKNMFMPNDDDGDSKTRIGMIDGQEVVFELQECVTRKPTTSREEREKHQFQRLNVTGSPFEVRVRWWLMQYSLPSITILYFTAFLALNFIFAGLWSIQDGRCCDDESLTYTQIFDFAIQTSTTIGYGGESTISIPAAPVLSSNSY